jgi:hypothetical protein
VVTVFQLRRDQVEIPTPISIADVPKRNAVIRANDISVGQRRARQDYPAGDHRSGFTQECSTVDRR